MTDVFGGFPSTSPLWIFPFMAAADSRALIETEVRKILADWKSHGEEVSGAFEIKYDSFLLVAARPDSTSGCSIDSLFRQIREMFTALGIKLLDNSKVFFLDDGEVRVMTRAEFSDFVPTSGKITADTKVFDNSVHTLGEYLGGKWERRFAESWHAKAFGL